MVKAESVNKQKNYFSSYPIILKHLKTGIVVLFSDEKSGTIIKRSATTPAGRHPIGEHSNHWSLATSNEWEVYNETIMLCNE